MAAGLAGVAVDDAEQTAGMLHHHYPCLAGMAIDPEYNDTLMHVSGHLRVDEVARQVKPYKRPPLYLRPAAIIRRDKMSRSCSANKRAVTKTHPVPAHRVTHFQSTEPMTTMDFLRALLAHGADGAYVVDQEQPIVAWNDGAENPLGFRAQDLVGSSCFQVLGGHAEGGRLPAGAALPFSAGPRGEQVSSFDVQVRTTRAPTLGQREYPADPVENGHEQPR